MFQSPRCADFGNSDHHLRRGRSKSRRKADISEQTRGSENRGREIDPSCWFVDLLCSTRLSS